MIINIGKKPFYCDGKAGTVIDRLMIIRKSELSDKKQWDFLQVVIVLLLLYDLIT